MADFKCFLPQSYNRQNLWGLGCTQQPHLFQPSPLSPDPQIQGEVKLKSDGGAGSRRQLNGGQ